MGKIKNGGNFMKIINKLNKIYEYRKTLVSITVVYNLVSAVIKLLLIL